MSLAEYERKVSYRDEIFQTSEEHSESEKEKLEALYRIYNPERFQTARKHMTVDKDPLETIEWIKRCQSGADQQIYLQSTNKQNKPNV